jgi:tetratricopeptide (TPR) repeat protein
MLKKNLTYLLVGAAFGCLMGWMIYRAAGLSPATSPPAAAPAQAAAGSGGMPEVMQELEALRARLEQDPNDFPALVQIGDVLYRTQIWDEALRFYERAHELQPSADLLTVSGLCLGQLQRHDEALQRFEAARELDPGHWQSLYNIVTVHLALEDRDGAEQALVALEAERPDDPNVAALRAEVEKRRQVVSD